MRSCESLVRTAVYSAMASINAVHAALLLAALSGCSATSMRSRAPTVICRITDDKAHDVGPHVALYPSRHSTLIHVSGDRYVDLTLHPLSPVVRAYVLSVPHSPWTFGEVLLDQTTLTLENQPGLEARASISAALPGATLNCSRARHF